MFAWKAIEVLDMGIGFLGLFAAAVFVITVLMEITGRSALGWALTLLALVVALGALLLVRHRLLDAEAHGGPRVGQTPCRIGCAELIRSVAPGPALPRPTYSDLHILRRCI